MTPPPLPHVETPHGGVVIYVDGAPVGNAATVEVEASRKQVELDGLDPLANVYFSTLVGPADARGTAVGQVAVYDGPAQRWLLAPDAQLSDFSSGTQHVVLVSADLAESPLSRR